MAGRGHVFFARSLSAPSEVTQVGYFLQHQSPAVRNVVAAAALAAAATAAADDARGFEHNHLHYCDVMKTNHS